MKISFKPYLYVGKAKGDIPVEVMVRMSARGETALLPVNVKLSPSMWDKETASVKKCPQKAFLDRAISERLYKAQETLLEISEKEGEDLLRSLSLTQIKNLILERLDGKRANEKGTFAKDYHSFTNEKSGRTKEIYEATWKRICEYTDRAEELRYENVTVAWLRGFDEFLQVKSPAVNARSIHFRNIRAVFNRALDDERTELYPFRKFKIKSAPTAKRSLSEVDIRKIATMPMTQKQEFFRDIFMLDFYLIGINMVDLYKLTTDNVQNGRMIYTRSKTKKLYSIKIEPEAQAILDRHKGKAGLLDIADIYKNDKIFTRQFNKALKTFGSWDYLSSYWARHSWATIAYNDCDIPIDVISQALGHSMGTSKVTMVYINADSKKVDEANRKVIDRVLGK